MIFFDIDGTLIDHAAASAGASLSFYDHFAGKIPFPRESFPAVWDAIVDKHFNRYCRAEISMWEQRRARIRETFGDESLPDAECDARYRVYILEYESLTEPYADVAPCLRELRGTPLGIISNGARDQQTRKLERAGLLPYFSALVFSEDVGIGKPAARIFKEACARAGKLPGECIHVGDDPAADVAGCAAAGMQPAWLDRRGRGSVSVSTPRIESLQQLAPMIEDIAKGTNPCLARN